MQKILEYGNRTRRSENTWQCVCTILVDTEADILSLSENNMIGDIIPAPGSTAETADGSALYRLSPSGVWTKDIKAKAAAAAMEADVVTAEAQTDEILDEIDAYIAAVDAELEGGAEE